jgi:hypothetical protein
VCTPPLGAPHRFKLLSDLALSNTSSSWNGGHMVKTSEKEILARNNYTSGMLTCCRTRCQTRLLAGPVASLLSSGPIVATPGSTEIKPSTAAIKKPNILPDCIAPSCAFGLLYDLRNQCSQFVCNCWFYPSLEDHFSRVPDPTHLENWLALNEARILCHVASRRHPLHTSQQHITDYFTPVP